MKTITRRQFLKYSGAVGASGAVLSIDDIAEAAMVRPLPSGTPILVVITLYGGNDGLNTVVPYQDSLYFSLRSDLAYKPEQLLPLDSSLALNGSMSEVKSLWDKNQVAIIRGVGYPKSDRSHFTSMAIWQKADTTNLGSTGWIGRWVDTQPEDPMLAISLGSILPPLFVGKKKSGSALPLGGLTIPTGSLASDCQKLSLPSPADSTLMSFAAESMRNLFSLSSTITPVLKQPEPTTTELPTVNGGNAGGDSNLSAQLDVVAKLINAGSPTRVWSASLGGFDTHANEANAQAALLGSLSSSIGRFMTKLKSSGRDKDVTILVYSEFGRRVAANASQGTDHGTAGPAFVIGSRIKGGFYGDQPSLSQLKDGDLAVTTDFRDIYASLIEKTLGSDPTRIIPGWRGRIAF